MKKPHAHLQTNIKMYVKFQKDLPETVRRAALTRKQGWYGYLQCSNGNSSNSGQSRFTVLEFSMSSHCAIHLCEVSWKYLEGFQVTEQTQKHDKQTDRLREKQYGET